MGAVGDLVGAVTAGSQGKDFLQWVQDNGGREELEIGNMGYLGKTQEWAEYTSAVFSVRARKKPV